MFKEKAKEVLKGNYGEAIIAFLIPALIVGSVTMIFPRASFLTLLLFPIELGTFYFFMNLRKQNAKIDDVFVFIRERSSEYFRLVWVHIIRIVFIVLWSLLLIVPGIIKGISYAMVNYILIDEDFKLEGTEVIALSEEMMQGHKMDYFVLGLSFLGWIILSLLTAGILFLYTIPYMTATFTEFYYDVKEKYLGDTVEGTEL